MSIKQETQNEKEYFTGHVHQQSVRFSSSISALIIYILPVLGCDDSTWKKLSREYEDCLMRWQQQLVQTDYKSKEFCGLASELLNYICCPVPTTVKIAA